MKKNVVSDLVCWGGDIQIDEHVQREIRNHSSLKHPNIIIFKEHQLKPFRARSGGNTVMGIYLSSPKREKFSEEGGNGRLRYGLSSMQGWRATMEDAFEEVADYGSQESDFMGSSHAAITDLDATTSFFGVYDGHGGKVVAKFSCKFLHQHVLKNEEHAAGDIGTSVQKAFFRLLDFITKEFFLSPSRRVVEVSIVIIALDVEIKSRNHENEKLLKGLDVMKSVLHSAPSLNTRLLPQGSAGVLDGKTTLLQGGGTPSQPGFDTRDELIGQTPQPVAPAVPAIPSSQKPLPLTTRSNPDDLRRKTISLMEEYFSVQILDEALQCVEELKDPAFHPEVTISLALEKSPPCVGPVIKLLEFLLTKKVLTARDIGTGLDFEVLKELLEKLEDNRFRKAIFEEHQLQGKKWWQHSSPKKEKFSEDGGNGRLRYGLSSMQGWRATMEDAHAAIIDLDATTSFFGVYNCHGGKNCKFQSDFIVSLADLWLCPYMNKVKVIAAMFNSTGDIGTSVQKAFFRMDEMMRGQRSWRELAALGDKINKFTGMIEGLIWSPRCGGSNEQPDDWAFEEYLDKWTYRHIVDMEKSHMSNSGSLPLDFLMRSKVVAKFCSKFLHQQVLKKEAYAAGDIGTSVQKAFFSMPTSGSAFKNMQNTNNVAVCELVIIALDVEIQSRNHENEKLLKGLDVMKSMLHSASSLINKAPSLNTRLLPQGSAGVLDGKTTLLQGSGTPSQPGFDTRDELIGQTPQPVAPAVPAIPSPQKPLPLTTRSNPDDLRRKTISLLEEYFSVQILDEALQCVEELKDPAFHPEVTISLALEKSPPCVGPVIKLLEFLLTKKVLTARDIGTGLDFEVLKELLEKLEDNRFRKAIFEEHQLQGKKWWQHSSPKKEKFSEDGGNGRLRYGLSSMQGWRATMEDAHAAIIDLDATTSFFGVYNCHGGKNCKFQSDFIVSLVDLWLCPYMNKVKVIAAMFNSTGDIGTSVQKAFFRMDEMMRGQRSWRELAALGDKINKFTGMIEGLISSPR
uniref:protein-serine/threonine phosphatase n=1 Tax=Salix viminalis TaxID=40686 RepID=A0A6N2KHS1_SALVM